MKRLALDTMDLPAVQAWLEDWAARGWYLESYGTHWAQFVPEEKSEHVRYRLQPVKSGELAPDEDMRTTYQEMGWTYVCTTRSWGLALNSKNSEFHIWRCGDPEAPELDTDQILRAENYAYLLRRWRREMLSALAAVTAVVLALLWLNWWNPQQTLMARYPSGNELLVLFDSWLLVWSGWRALRLIRFTRRLRAEEPVPQRVSWQPARRRVRMFRAACWGMIAAMAGMMFFTEDSRAFVPVSQWDEPVPYVSLSELDPSVPSEEAEALDYHSVWAKSVWWVIQQGEGESCDTRYFSLRMPSMARNLERQFRRYRSQFASTAYQAQAVPPELDALWYNRRQGLQCLLLRRGGQVLEVSCNSGEDLLEHVEDYIALLETFRQRGK